VLLAFPWALRDRARALKGYEWRSNWVRDAGALATQLQSINIFPERDQRQQAPAL
jgi:hypothetical protein